MAIILHKNIIEGEKHTPKGFNLPATNSMSYALRSESDVAIYQDVEYLPGALNFVDGNNPPPSAVVDDIFVIFDGGGGVVDAAWGGIAFNSWTRQDGSNWFGVVPVDGYQCYDKTAKVYKTFNGTAWVFGGSGGANLSEGTTTNTTVDVDSDSGTNATILAASTLRAGVQTKANFDAVTANTAKVSNATHTSEVTGSTALTVDKIAISNKTLVTADGADHVLIGDASDSDNLKKVLVSDFLGGGGNLGDTNLTLSGAVVRTYNIDGNELKFIDGANNKLKVTASGVGIGNVGTPAAELEVRGTGTTSGTTALLVENSAGTDLLEVKDDGRTTIDGAVTINRTTGNSALTLNGASNSNNQLYFSKSGAAKWYLRPNYAAAGSDEFLILNGSDAQQLRLNQTGEVSLGGFAPVTNERLRIKGFGVGNNIALAVTNNSNVVNFQVLDNGSVGIGGAPTEKVTVINGTVKATTLSNRAVVWIDGASNANSSFLITKSGANKFVIQPNFAASGDDSIQFYTGGAANVMVMQQGGNVGFGTATPNAKVEVNGSFRFNGAMSVNGTAGFTGTGAYTNFTITNGIITNAS